MTKSPLIRIAALGCALVLGACSSGGSGGSDGASKPAAAAVESHPDGGVKEMPKLTGDKGIYKDTTVKSCELGPGPVKANGTVKNQSKKALDIVVAVRWVAPKGNSVIDQDIAVLRKVAPGKTAAWSLTGDVSTSSKAECSFSVVGGSLA